MRLARVCLVVAACCFVTVRAGATELGTFEPLSTTVDGETRAGAVYIPANYDADSKYPLIVFLHGSGERGNDGMGQTTVGIGKAIRENPERFPCIVYMPQCATDDNWAQRPGRNESTAHAHIAAGIDAVIDTYSIDQDRISLTGLSMGGGGTFVHGALNPDRFSAYAAICGRGSKRLAEPLSKRPLWAIHGDADSVIPLHTSEMMVSAIRELGGDAKLTVYEGVGHNSWDRAYAPEQGLVEWLLAQSR